MRSCLGLIVAIIVLTAFLATLGGIYQMSRTTEFERKSLVP